MALVAEVVALLMFIGPDIVKEISYPAEPQRMFAIRGSRRDRSTQRSIQFTCKAKKGLEENIDGTKKIISNIRIMEPFYTSEYYHSFYIALRCNLCRVKR